MKQTRGAREISAVRQAVIAAGVLAAGSTPAAGASVTGHPQPQLHVPPVAVAPWRAARSGPHVFYGTIAALRGSLLIVRLRNGRLQSVDASAAIAHGDCSQPLFVGKLVSVDGNTTGTKFVAAHILRLNNLADLRADR